MQKRALSVLLLCTLAGCGSVPKNPHTPQTRDASTSIPSRKGAYYQDDGPGTNPPVNLDQLPNAIPRVEPYARAANRPYVALGQEFVPDLSDRPFKQRGTGSWYGRKYHGQKTSSGEIYDMYAMTAAHPTLPIPSYIRVTNLANGKSIIVRVNDRGPFLANRIVDLSYAGAYKLGYVNQGSAVLEIERLLPADIAAGRIDADPIIAQSAPFIPSSPNAISSAPAIISAATALPISANGNGFFLQLGAFRQQSGAEEFSAKMKINFEHLNVRLRIVPGKDWFRVQLGPYADKNQALAAVEQIRLEINLNPLVVSP